MKTFPKFSVAALAAAAMAFPAVTSSGQTVLFDFNNNGVVGAVDSGVLGAPVEGAGVFDPGVVGDTATVGGLVLTVSDLVAPVYNDDFSAIIGSISAAAGDPGLLANISTSDSLGVFNPGLGNGDGAGAESNVINAGEAISFTFDQPVKFTAIEFEGTAAGDLLEVRVDGAVINAATRPTEGFQPLGGLKGLVIDAGTNVTFAVDGTFAGTSIAIETFTVEVVPEPA